MGASQQIAIAIDEEASSLALVFAGGFFVHWRRLGTKRDRPFFVQAGFAR